MEINYRLQKRFWRTASEFYLLINCYGLSRLKLPLGLLPTFGGKNQSIASYHYEKSYYSMRIFYSSNYL